MTETMTETEARALVARYRAAELEVERLFQPLVVAAYNAMRDAADHGPHTTQARHYRALEVGRADAFAELARDIYDQYPSAVAIVATADAAQARADTDALIDLDRRIAYGD